LAFAILSAEAVAKAKLDALSKSQQTSLFVIPANPPEVYPPDLWRVYPPPEGGQEPESRDFKKFWTPACAGVTASETLYEAIKLVCAVFLFAMLCQRCRHARFIAARILSGVMGN